MIPFDSQNLGWAQCNSEAAGTDISLKTLCIGFLRHAESRAVANLVGLGCLWQEGQEFAFFSKQPPFRKWEKQAENLLALNICKHDFTSTLFVPFPCGLRERARTLHQQNASSSWTSELNLCIDRFTPHPRLCICEMEAVAPPPLGFHGVWQTVLSDSLISTLFSSWGTRLLVQNSKCPTEYYTFTASHMLGVGTWEQGGVLVWVSGCSF